MQLSAHAAQLGGGSSRGRAWGGGALQGRVCPGSRAFLKLTFVGLVRVPQRDAGIPGPAGQPRGGVGRFEQGGVWAGVAGSAPQCSSAARPTAAPWRHPWRRLLGNQTRTTNGQCRLGRRRTPHPAPLNTFEQLSQATMRPAHGTLRPPPPATPTHTLGLPVKEPAWEAGRPVSLVAAHLRCASAKRGMRSAAAMLRLPPARTVASPLSQAASGAQRNGFCPPLYEPSYPVKCCAGGG